MDTATNENQPPPVPNAVQTRRGTVESDAGVLLKGGTVIGFLLMIAGLGLSLTPDADNEELERLLGKVLIAVGAALGPGGVLVLILNRFAKREPTDVGIPARTPAWAYVISALCLLLCFGGFVGALCGLLAAPITLAIAKSRSLSLPHRVYACVLVIAFAWLCYFLVSSQLLSILQSRP